MASELSELSSFVARLAEAGAMIADLERRNQALQVEVEDLRQLSSGAALAEAQARNVAEQAARVAAEEERDRLRDELGELRAACEEAERERDRVRADLEDRQRRDADLAQRLHGIVQELER
jgi:chromosome segregation ATPase